MNVSSARNLIDWWTSRSCKLVSLCVICASVVVGSFSLPVAASAVDTSDWVEVDVTPYVLYCEKPTSSTKYVQLEEYGGSYYYNIRDPEYNHQRTFTLSSYFPELIRGCTYVLTFTVKYTNLGIDTRVLSITPELPVSIVGVQYNSLGTELTDLVSISTESEYLPKDPSGDYTFFTYSIYETTIIFNTSDGYVDNFETGPQFLNLEQWSEYVYDNDMSDSTANTYYIEITEIDASCVFDPSAEYLLELTKQRQNKLVDLTKESVGKMKESLEQVTIIDDMSLAVDYVSGAIGNAAALVSPAATYADTGGVNIYPAFALFSTIYNSVMGSVDPALLALAATVPLLCFLAWLFSSLFKSFL